VSVVIIVLSELNGHYLGRGGVDVDAALMRHHPKYGCLQETSLRSRSLSLPSIEKLADRGQNQDIQYNNM